MYIDEFRHLRFIAGRVRPGLHKTFSGGSHLPQALCLSDTPLPVPFTAERNGLTSKRNYAFRNAASVCL
jgi:hypothetical protein